MHAIRHRIGVHAPLEDVYGAFATGGGVAQWWTRDTSGEDRVGGQLAFRFGGPETGATVEVVDLDPPSRVRWRVVRGPEEWIDTTITFELKRQDDQTIVLFTHDGWDEPAEFMHHCSTKWAYFLLGLKHGHEGGKANPWPEDEKVDNWG